MFARNPISRKLVIFFNGALILFLSILTTVTVKAQRPIGTDVSGYQAEYIDWAGLVQTDGVSFAYVKATEGTTYENPYFTTQLAGAASAGIYVGAYHFARPSKDPNITGANSADSEATYFWSVAGSYVKAGNGYLVPVLDWEDTGATNAAGFTQTFMSQWLNEWCNDVSNRAAAQGVIIRPAVYTGTWYSVPTSGNFGYPGLNTTVTNWPNWFSDYPNNPDPQTGSPTYSPWPTWNIWQYSDADLSGGDSDVYNGSLQNFLLTFEVGGSGAPYVVAAPTNITAGVDSSATFNAQVGGQLPGFQWYFDKRPIPGATSSTYTIANVELTNAGVYSVTASNSYSSVSAVATLSVLAPLVNPPNSILDPSNMVNWWTGNGNPNDIYGVTNLSPSGYLTYTNGKTGMAFDLDGSTAYMTNRASEIAPPWTVSAWVYRQNAPGVSSALMGDKTYALKLEQYNATREAGISWSAHGDYLFSPAYTIPQNTWTHLAYVATSSGVTLYTNGVQEGTVTVSSFQLPRTYIGVDTFSGLPSDFMLGAVDDLQVYNRALAAFEVKSIYNAGSAGLVRAPQFTGVTNLANGQVQLNLIGQTGKSISLLSSTDLLNWASTATIANPTGATNYTDTTASPQMFYQATQKY